MVSVDSHNILTFSFLGINTIFQSYMDKVLDNNDKSS